MSRSTRSINTSTRRHHLVPFHHGTAIRTCKSAHVFAKHVAFFSFHLTVRVQHDWWTPDLAQPRHATTSPSCPGSTRSIVRWMTCSLPSRCPPALDHDSVVHPALPRPFVLGQPFAARASRRTKEYSRDQTCFGNTRHATRMCMCSCRHDMIYPSLPRSSRHACSP